MEKSTEQIALEYLEKKPLLHAGMTEPIRRGSAEILFAGDDGVLLRETRSGAVMISVTSPVAGEKMIAGLVKPELFVAHQQFCVSLIRENFGYVRLFDCVQAVYTRYTKLPVTAGIEIGTLSQTCLPAVLNHYHTIDDPDYIRKLICRREIFGAFIEGSLAGFIGIHDEGSMGLLEVFPEFRRRGVGTALISFLVNYHLEKGQIPFGQIMAGNVKSVRLQEKLGFEISADHLYWLF